MTVLAQLLELSVAKRIMITCAESCTGGLVASQLTERPGSSAMFDRGFVTYTNDAKIAMLGVRRDTLEQQGAVSEPVAAQMAQGALSHSLAGLAVSITGIAGPGGSDHKPEGRACFGLAWDDHVTTQTVEFGALGRSAVRQAATTHALLLLRDTLKELPEF